MYFKDMYGTAKARDSIASLCESHAHVDCGVDSLGLPGLGRRQGSGLIVRKLDDAMRKI